MWEHLPAELAVPVSRREGKKHTAHSIALLERGFALYEDPRAFDAMWSGEHVPMNGLSVVEGVLTRIVEDTPDEPRAKDRALATAVMRLLINLVTGGPLEVTLGRGARLELKPQTPGKKSG